jgi:hypothetical protein
MPWTTCLLLASKRITGEIYLPSTMKFLSICSVKEERLWNTKYRNYGGLAFSQQIGSAVCSTEVCTCTKRLWIIMLVEKQNKKFQSAMEQ